MTNDRITGPCPDCERTRAENARLKSERPYMVDRPYEDLTRLEAYRAENARLREALEEICAKEFWYDSEGYCAAETMQSIARAALEVKHAE